MSLASTIGITSGINFDQLVSQLMAIEMVPLQRLQQRIEDYNQKISAVGTLTSVLSTLKDAVKDLRDTELLGMTATSSDMTVLSATATPSASEGTYRIVVNRLAQAQSLYSETFTSENEPVADLSVSPQQRLKIQVGSSEPITITIDSSNNTLAGIRDAINDSALPLRASVVNDGTGYRLILTATNTGASNTITVQVDEDNDGVFEEASETDATGLSRLAFNPGSYDQDGNPQGGVQQMLQSIAARDAEVVVDGLTVTRSSNSISDLITGVTINLLKESNGQSLTLTISEDNQTLRNKLNAFVSAYNQLVATAGNLKGTKDNQGPLYTEALLSRITSSLRDITVREFNGRTLVSLGITHDRQGNLQFDESVLEDVLSESPDEVIETIHDMAEEFYSMLDNYLSEIIPAKTEGLQSSKRYLQERADSMELRLQMIEEGLRQRFYLLEQTLARLQNESNYVSQQLNNISKIVGDKR